MSKTLLTLFFPLLVVVQAQQTTDSPLNVILLIGDGMGLTQISAGMYVNNNQTVLEDFPVIGLSKTMQQIVWLLTLLQAEPPWPAEKNL